MLLNYFSRTLCLGRYDDIQHARNRSWKQTNSSISGSNFSVMVMIFVVKTVIKSITKIITSRFSRNRIIFKGYWYNLNEQFRWRQKIIRDNNMKQEEKKSVVIYCHDWMEVSYINPFYSNLIDVIIFVRKCHHPVNQIIFFFKIKIQYSPNRYWWISVN